MKLLVSVAISLSLLLTYSCKEDEIPPSVKQSFESKYPTAENAKWNEDDDVYKVRFEINDDDYEAIYSVTGGIWIETTEDIDRDELPLAVLDVLNSEMYSSWEVNDVARAEAADHPGLYKIQVKVGDKEEYHYYDEQGNLVKKQN